jgi:hypothetical protein
LEKVCNHFFPKSIILYAQKTFNDSPQSPRRPQRPERNLASCKKNF